MPCAIASRSPPPVSTCSPFLPFTIAVPVSWHDGRMPPAAMHAFFSSSVATNTSLGDASGSSRIARELREMTRTQEVRDLEHRGLRQQRQRLGVDLQEAAAAGFERRHVVAGEQAVGRLVGPEREQLLVGEFSTHAAAASAPPSRVRCLESNRGCGLRLAHGVTVVGLVRNTVLGMRWHD